MDVAPRRVDRSPLERLAESRPELASCLGDLGAAADVMVATLERDGTVFLAGNGGSMADALHIAGELKKGFERHRPLPAELAGRLRASGGGTLADGLDAGLRVVVLGADPVLRSAVDNDLAVPDVAVAQELVALARPGDALVVLSTSARSANVTNAALVARALGVAVVVITGNHRETRLLELADVVVRAPSTSTAEIQSLHSVLYHALCRVLEDTFFPAGG